MRKLYKEFMSIKQQEKISDKAIMLRMAMMIMIILASLATMSMSAYAFFTYNITSGVNNITAANFEVEITIEEKTVVLPEGAELTSKSVSQEDALEAIEINDEVKDSTAVNPISEQTEQANLTEMTVTTVTEKEPVELTGLYTDTYICANKYQVDMKGGNVYTITLKPSGNSTAKTGFVIITAENCDSKYHTQQIDVSNGNTEPLTFLIEPNGDTKVTFTAHWGTSSFYDDYRTEGDNEEMYITQGEEIVLSINGAQEQQKLNLTLPAKDSKSSTEETQESSETTAPFEDTSVENTSTETTDTGVAITTTEQSSTAEPMDTQESTETQATLETEEATGTTNTEETKE